jgi:hypothetical protein
MSTPTGAPAAACEAKVVLDYVAPATALRPPVLRHCVWYFLTLASILFLSAVAAVAAVTAV